MKLNPVTDNVNAPPEVAVDGESDVITGTVFGPGEYTVNVAFEVPPWVRG